MGHPFYGCFQIEIHAVRKLKGDVYVHSAI